MQLSLGFLETPSSRETTEVWTVLDDDHRQLVLAILARLIAKLAIARLTPTAVADEEQGHASDREDH